MGYVHATSQLIWWDMETRIPTCPPLKDSERGRGVSLSLRRTRQLEDYCAQKIIEGAWQKDLCQELNASRSRLSRWSVEGLKRADLSLRRLSNTSHMTLTQMLWSRIKLSGPDDCWVWQGSIKSNGYGGLNYKGKAGQAHRMVYEALISEVPDGMVIDHVCRNRRCVNPRHLQPVKPSLNAALSAVRRA